MRNILSDVILPIIIELIHVHVEDSCKALTTITYEVHLKSHSSGFTALQPPVANYVVRTHFHFSPKVIET